MLQLKLRRASGPATATSEQTQAKVHTRAVKMSGEEGRPSLIETLLGPYLSDKVTLVRDQSDAPCLPFPLTQQVRAFA
jgi:hypothetical protein